MTQNSVCIDGLCREAEDFSLSSDWFSAEKFFAELDPKMELADPERTHGESREKLAIFKERFLKRHEAHKEKKALVADAESICAQIEEKIGGNSSAAVDLVEELSKAWFEKPLAKIPKEYLEILQSRFDKAVKAFFAAKRRLDDEYEANRARIADIESMCAEMEAIARAPVSKQFSDRAKHIQSDWSLRFFEYPGSDAIQSRFSAAVEELGKKEAEERRLRNERLEAERCLLEKSVAEMTEFLKDEDIRRHLPRVREIKSLLSGERPLQAAKKRLHEECLKQVSEFFTRLRTKFEEEDWARWEHYTYKLDLCKKAESLLEEKDFFVKSRILSELKKDWKDIGSVPKEKSEEVWKRFSTACETLSTESRKFFAELELRRQESLAKKIPICEEIEKLCQSEDWQSAADKIVELRRSFFDIENAPKEKEEELRNRIKTSCDSFFAKRKERFQAIHAEQSENKKAKLALCEEAEALVGLSSEIAVRKAKDLRMKWKEIGNAHYKDERKLRDSFNAALDKLFHGLDDARSRISDARIALCDELANLSGRLAELGAEELREALKKCKSAWNEIKGYGRRNDEKEIADRYFALLSEIEGSLREKNRALQISQRENTSKKLGIIEKIGKMLSENVAPDAEAIEKLKNEWELSGECPPESRERLEKLFSDSLAAFAEGKTDFFSKLKTKQAKTISEKRRLCVELEKITGIFADGKGENESGAVSLDALNELKFALESNLTLGKKRDDPRETEERVREIESLWAKLESYPNEDDSALGSRFSETLSKFRSRRGR